MVKEMKCDLCGNREGDKVYNVVELATRELNDPDDTWELKEDYDVCKSCKRKIKGFINKLKKK